MKTRTNRLKVTASKTSECCNTIQEAAKSETCCEQPSDGAACCDKHETKEENVVKTGCC